jgi:ubiquinone/menaquinone biosynthesis C-methylase UbiE
MAGMYDKFAGQADFHKLLKQELVARSGWIGVDLTGKKLRVLDYACGTGVVSQVRETGRISSGPFYIVP